MKDNRFGINMKRFCREHEARVTAAVEAGEATPELLEEHLRMIAWVQHEQLVHLIVTVMVVLCELFTVDLVLLHPELGIVPAVIMLGLAVLLAWRTPFKGGIGLQRSCGRNERTGYKTIYWQAAIKNNCNLPVVLL